MIRTDLSPDQRPTPDEVARQFGLLRGDVRPSTAAESILVGQSRRDVVTAENKLNRLTRGRPQRLLPGNPPVLRSR